MTFQCEDIKTVAQLNEPKDEIVYCRYKKQVPPHKNIVSTVHRSYLITLSTKAIDTTSELIYLSTFMLLEGRYLQFFVHKKWQG